MDPGEEERLIQHAEILCSEVVNFISEWRCFVRYGKIVGIRFYYGDERLPFTAESRTCCAITGHNLWFEMGFAHRRRRFVMAKPVTITLPRAVNSNEKYE